MDFDGQYQTKKFVDEARVNEILRPVLTELYGQIGSNRDQINEKADKLKIELENEMDKAKFQVSSISNDLDAYKKFIELQHLKSQTVLERTKNDFEFNLKNLAETIDLEKQEILKMKQQIKL